MTERTGVHQLVYPLDAVSVHLVRNLFALIALAIVDHVVVRELVRGVAKARDRRAARWFFVHAIGNFFVVACAFTSVLAVLQNPLHAADPSVMMDRSLFGNASPWPLTILNSLHLYVFVHRVEPSSYARLHPPHHRLCICTRLARMQLPHDRRIRPDER